MQAEIINIGEELLIGQVVNTNATWLCEKLNESAIAVKYNSIVSDNYEDIKSAIETAIRRVDIIVITGGLGPTKDDLTKDVLVDYFNTELELNEVVLDDIKKYFGKRAMDINEQNYLQAMVPKSCKIIRNPEGTAPGLIFQKSKKTIVALPGVPYEMKYMFEKHFLPEIKKGSSSDVIIHKTVLTIGIPESFLAEKLNDWENTLTQDIQLAYLPSAGTVRLRLTYKGNNKEEANQKINNEVKKLQKIIPEFIYGYDNDRLEEIIIKQLTKSGLSLGVAESCTGGYISHLLTSIPGSSKCFKGSVISYSNEFKINQLDVPVELIEKYGAVSSHVAIAMAEGAKNHLNTDYSIGITGVAGPTGGTMIKPVGLVFIAVSGKNETICRDFLFGDNRERNIIRSALTALNMLRKQIIKAA